MQKHVVQVDLSAKVEQWSKDTALVFSNDITGSVLIRGKNKQKIRNQLQKKYPNRKPAFYYRYLFALFIFMLVKPVLGKLDKLVIDCDYPGNESEQMIKVYLLNFCQKVTNRILGKNFIDFREVRGSKADILARDIFKGRQKADRIISAMEVFDCWQ